MRVKSKSPVRGYFRYVGVDEEEGDGMDPMMEDSMMKKSKKMKKTKTGGKRKVNSWIRATQIMRSENPQYKSVVPIKSGTKPYEIAKGIQDEIKSGRRK